jgi:hypothetical protein
MSRTKKPDTPKKEPQGPNLEDLVKQVLTDPKNRDLGRVIKNLSKEDQANLMVSIVKNQFTLYRKEIADYEFARTEAMDSLYPRRLRLIEFYNDLFLDPFIGGLVENRRILKISNKRIKVVNSKGDKDDELSKLFDRMWFNDFVKYAMEARFFGFSCVQFYKRKANGEFDLPDLIYRENILPERSMILNRVYDSTGIDITQPPFSNYIMLIQKAGDLGIFNKAAILYILKKHSWGNWDEFEEMFGVPIRIAKTASQDKKVQSAITAWLADMGSASFGLFPLDTELEVIENKGKDAFQVFNEKRKACNEELEVLITGLNRITQQGGSYAKEKVNEAETDQVTLDDKTYLRYIIIDHLLPMMRVNGYKIPEDHSVDWDDAKEVDKTDLIDIYTKVNDMGFELDPKDVEARFGVKIIGKKEVKPIGDPGKQPKEKGFKKNEYREFKDFHNKLGKLYQHDV